MAEPLPFNLTWKRPKHHISHGLFLIFADCIREIQFFPCSLPAFHMCLVFLSPNLAEWLHKSLLMYWQSPTVVIDQYMADSHDKRSLEWLETVQTERRFRQSHTLMWEMILYFARNIPQNSRVLKRVNSWCSAMSVSHIFWAIIVCTYETFEGDCSLLLDTGHRHPILTRNMRRHKPRPSDLSSEESQQLRKTLNEGSPSRRRK